MKPVILLKSGLAKSGGVEKYTKTLAAAFLSKGHSVTILTSGPTSTLKLDPEIEIISFPEKGLFSFQKVASFDQFCTAFVKNKPDSIVFGLDRNSFQTHLRAGSGVHLSYLARREETEGRLMGLRHRINPLHRLILDIEKRSFEDPRLQKLYTNSHMVKQEVLSRYAVDSSKLVVIHNGVEWAAFEKDFALWPEKKNEMMATLGLDPNCLQLLFVGHNYQRKGLERILRGLSLISDKSIQLSVVGKEKNIDQFRALAKRLRIETRVFFFGARNDLSSFYQVADALVIPSFYDPFANVTVEALAFGLYTISSKSNGGCEVLTPETGCVIEELNSDESVAAALKKAHPKTLASAQAIRQSVAHLDFSRQLNGYTAL